MGASPASGSDIRDHTAQLQEAPNHRVRTACGPLAPKATACWPIAQAPSGPSPLAAVDALRSRVITTVWPERLARFLAGTSRPGSRGEARLAHRGLVVTERCDLRTSFGHMSSAVGLD